MKTVCFFNSNKAWGGGEKWHLETAKKLHHDGYKVIIFANENSELAKKAHDAKLAILTIKVSNLSFLNPFKLFKVCSILKLHNVDSIILNLPADLKLAGIAAKLTHIPKIIYRRGMPHPIKNRPLNRLLFKYILTHVIVNSKEIGRSLVQLTKSWFPENKIKLIYNGVDISNISKAQNVLIPKENGTIVLGNAGRLTTQKGQKYLIEVSKNLKAKGIKFKTLIAGTGELKEELTSLIAKENLQNEVELIGHVNDMPAFFNSIDIFVFPSLFEGTANTLIEALLHEKPCVAFNVSSNPEVIEHETNGLLAKAFDSDDFTLQILKLIKNPELQQKFKKSGLEKVSIQFDSKKVLEELKAII